MKKTLNLFLYVSLSISALASHPNIVYIFADDMGVGDVSCLNSEAKLHTPNLDKLAAGGAIFTDAHTSSSVCTPTRYGLLTGRYSWRSELKARVVDGYGKSVIRDGIDTVPALLKRNGYQTAMIGKWHLGMKWSRKDGNAITEYRPGSIGNEIDFSKPFERGPTDHGFDYFFGINASLDFPPYTWLENDSVVGIPKIQRPGQGGKSKGEPQLMMRGGLQVNDFRPELILKGLTKKAVDYVDNLSKERPFFLYLPLNAPHTPVVPRDPFLGTSGCGIYGDFIHEIDWSVGEIVSALKKRGLLENTLIIFTADNGASRASFPDDFEEKYGHKPSGNYKGRKASLDEGGHRVPFIANWPGVVEPGSRVDVAFCLNDLYATCAEITGEQVAEDAGVDSFNMLSLLKGEVSAYSRNGLVHHDFIGRFAFREGDWKLNMGKEAKSKALYNLGSSLAEKENLINKHPEIAEQLEAKLNAIILNGRSTDGPKLSNEGPEIWDELYWLK